MGLKKLVLILGLLVSSGHSQVAPCEDYACDSLAVRAILDSNGMSNLSVQLVDKSELYESRIVNLFISELALTSLPSEIGNLTALAFK